MDNDGFAKIGPKNDEKHMVDPNNIEGVQETQVAAPPEPVFKDGRDGLGIDGPAKIDPPTTSSGDPKHGEQPPKVKKPVGLPLKILIGFGIFLFVFILALAIPSVFVYRQGRVLYQSAMNLKKAAVEDQNISEIKTASTTMRQDLGKFEKRLKLLSWTKITPGLNGYYSDALAATKAGEYGMDAFDQIVTTLEPYADIIGFTGNPADAAKSGEENANDRIQFIVSTIDQITPQLDQISQDTNKARDEINKINPARYPKTVAGKKVQDSLRQGIDQANEAADLVAKSKPLLEAAPYLLGIDGERTYLMLFQNDKELRPTGGFITAYAIMKVKDGKFSQVASSDIYSLDAKYRPSIDAPDALVKYIGGVYAAYPKFRLRDMNWNPDFPSSMALFTQEVEKTNIADFDGIIAVDTQVVVNLLDVLGQIGVPGFGNFTTAIEPKCDCPGVIYDLESFADVEGPVVWSENEPEKIVFAPPNYDNRKKIVGPLMNSILSNSLGQPIEKIPSLFEAGFKSLLEKHVLFWMKDAKAQQGVESFGIAGKLNDYSGDYLEIVDANLGGRKSNLYVTQEVHQSVDIKKDGSIEKTLEITYKNPKEQDGWLNSVLPNWTRIYVPKGSELVDVSGFEDKGETYEESGKTVFSGGFKLRPQGVVKISVTYRLPFKVDKGQYNLLIQKQPGTDTPLYTIEVGKQQEELYLKTDKEFHFRV